MEFPLTSLQSSVFILFPKVEVQHLISGNRYDGKEDFAVVLQPFLQNSFIPHIGVSQRDIQVYANKQPHTGDEVFAEILVFSPGG